MFTIPVFVGFGNKRNSVFVVNSPVDNVSLNVVVIDKLSTRTASLRLESDCLKAN